MCIRDSCTGGMISKYLTSINGSSLFFNGACISYSNKMKIRLLKVSKNTIINYGAVSHQTALAMVKGLKIITDSEILLSVTGVAGPSGGTARIPIGCVFFGIGSKIEINAESQSIVREVYPINTYRSQSPSLAHFGLNEIKLIDNIKIYWPSGNTQSFSDIKVNQHLIITENSQSYETLTSSNN